jgi:hypothetical protein
MRTSPHSLSLAALLVALPVMGQDHVHRPADPERIGRVSFPTSCAAAVQPQFERGMAMLHSFWFPEAERAFTQVLAADSTCAIAHWGIAMARRGNPIAGAPVAANLATGLAAAERAGALASHASPRERGFIDAALAFYRDHGSRDHRARMQAHLDAMRLTHEQNPQDPEAAMLYAIALVATAPLSDMTFAQQRAAADLLEPLFQRQPDHPGLAHYLIHAYDAPPLATRGLNAAARYSEIAPSAPHALHMPSHVFTRLGMWDESIESNSRAARAENNSPHAVHPMDYLVYAYLQQGRDRAADSVVQGLNTLSSRDGYAPIVRYNHFAMPARLVLERGDWAGAAALPVPQEQVGPEFLAIPRFARGIGAARAGQTAAARLEAAELMRLEEALRARGDSYWTVIVGAQRRSVEAWVAHAEGRHDEALRLAAEAAGQEESVEKHAVTPGPLLPARELQGDILLVHGRAAEAQAAYEANLRREPNRARSLYGAAVAAERAGNRPAANAHYASLARVMARADGERAEIAAARAHRH